LFKLVTGVVNNMSADRARKIDSEVKEIHTQVKKSSLILKQRMADLRQELEEYDSLGGMISGENSEGFMHS